MIPGTGFYTTEQADRELEYFIVYLREIGLECAAFCIEGRYLAARGSIEVELSRVDMPRDELRLLNALVAAWSNGDENSLAMAVRIWRDRGCAQCALAAAFLHTSCGVCRDKEGG